jgi:hypothetical protein
MASKQQDEDTGEEISQLQGMDILPGCVLLRQALCLVRSDNDGERWVKKMVYLARDRQKTNGFLLICGFGADGANVLEEVRDPAATVAISLQ